MNLAIFRKNSTIKIQGMNTSIVKLNYMTNAPGLPGEGFMKSMDTFFDLPETAINMSINLSRYIPINLRKSCTPKAGAVFSSVGYNHVGILIA